MSDEERPTRSRTRELLFIVLATVLAVQIHPALALVVLWYVLLKGLEEYGILDRWNATRILGVVLMIRTKRGQRVLEVISRPRAFWRGFGEVGLWTCRFAGVIVLILFVLSFIMTLLNPSAVEPASASDLVLIPGVSSTIPLGWGLAGLVIALVIHEYGHGVLARAHGMRVRSFGLLIIGLVPIGAFAEPETAELMRAPSKERQRVFAAGPAVNIYASFFCFLLMAVLANQFVSAVPGVHATGVLEEQPAAEAGLEAWEVITHVDGEVIADRDAMTAVLDSHRAGEDIELTVLSTTDSNGERSERTFSVTLADQYLYELERGTDPELLELYGITEGDAFLGVSGLSSNDAGAQRLAGPLRHDAPEGLIETAFGFAAQPMTIIFTPLQFKGEIMHPNELELLSAEGFPLGTDGLLAVIHLLFWVTWMNVLLGFANLIPLLPFDGGHLLRDRLHDYLSRLSKITGRGHPMRVRQLANKVSRISSLVILMMIVALVVIPMVV
jgi:membrane-associated protease RseP (regulator of RpoE activity)